MTPEELDAIPEMGGLTYRDNGDGTRTPIQLPVKALYHQDGEQMFVYGEQGQQWSIGYADGPRWKVKARSV